MVVGGRHQDFAALSSAKISAHSAGQGPKWCPGIGCSVDEEFRVVSKHEVAEVFTADLDPGFVFHVPQNPIDGDAEEG